MNVTEELLKLTIPLNEFLELDLTEISKLEKVIKRFNDSWSGSWIGYQANVYYKDFESPPTGAHFVKNGVSLIF